MLNFDDVCCRLKMKIAMKQAMDGTCLAMPSLQATRWVEALDLEVEYKNMRRNEYVTYSF
jgi:hypothetical protein